MGTPLPPPGTSIDAGPSFFTNPPQMPGLATSPLPAVTTPTFPATTVAVTNTTGVDVMVYALAGAAGLTVIKVNGTTIGLVTAASASASYYLPAGSTTAATYASGTPTWVWLAV
jgi:hypothetical protein